MRHKLLLLLAASALLISSCSKGGNDDDDDDEITTVKFTNTLTRSFNNVKIGIWKGDGNPAKLVKDVGTFAAGANTGEIKITDPTVVTVYFYYDETNGKTYMTDYGFGISQGTFNNWNINAGTSFMQISKTDDFYPR